MLYNIPTPTLHSVGIPPFIFTQPILASIESSYTGFPFKKLLFHNQFAIPVFIWLCFDLRILTGKKDPKIKLHRLRKIRIRTFGSMVHQINSFQGVLRLRQIFQKNKAFTGKTPLFVEGQFCSRHSVWLNIGFWQSSFEWKWCVFNLSGFN